MAVEQIQQSVETTLPSFNRGEALAALGRSAAQGVLAYTLAHVAQAQALMTVLNTQSSDWLRINAATLHQISQPVLDVVDKLQPQSLLMLVTALPIVLKRATDPNNHTRLNFNNFLGEIPRTTADTAAITIPLALALWNSSNSSPLENEATIAMKILAGSWLILGISRFGQSLMHLRSNILHPIQNDQKVRKEKVLEKLQDLRVEAEIGIAEAEAAISSDETALRELRELKEDITAQAYEMRTDLDIEDARGEQKGAPDLSPVKPLNLPPKEERRNHIRKEVRGLWKQTGKKFRRLTK